MLYFFKSTNNADAASCVGISGKSAKDALCNAVDYFYRSGFKGFPVQIAMSLVFMLCMSISVKAADNDTIAVDNSKITRIIEEKGVTVKGTEKTTYYIIYQGELVKTTKNVVEKYNLAKKYNCKCSLLLIKSKSGMRIILK